MTDEANAQPPAWWIVERRAAREADRQARRQQRAARREARREARHGAPAREPLTPERIADAALGIIDAGGVDSLTVRALAQALGVGTMTLYWYVQDKGEVLDLVADRLLADVDLPPPSEDWRSAVRDVASAVRAALLRHARAVPIIVGRGSLGPNGLRLIEGSMAVFRAAGFGLDEAANAYFTVSNFVIGHCAFETSRVEVAAGVTADPSAAGNRAAQYVSMLPPDRYPNLVAAAPHLFGGNREERFAFGLDCLIKGFADRLGAQPAAPGAGNAPA